MSRYPLMEVEILIDDETWQSVASLEQAGSDDRVYVLDSRSGRLQFGDGLHGRRPPAGSSLQATHRYGVGQAGNIATVTSSWIIPGPPQMVSLNITARERAIRFRASQVKFTWWRGLASWLCEWLKA